MSYTFLTHQTASNLDELREIIETARVQGLEPSADKVNKRDFFNYTNALTETYTNLDYVPWRDIRFVVLFEISPQAIEHATRTRRVEHWASVEVSRELITPKYISPKVYVIPIRGGFVNAI